MIAPNIVNVKWTFKNIPSGQRTPFEVPTNIINPTKAPGSSILSTFVTITDDPFVLSISSGDGTKVIDFTGMVYSSWLNIIKQTVY